MIPSTYASPKSLRLLLCACFMLMGCGLPAPDGTEAVLKARADELQPVKPSSRRDVKGALINGIILDPKIRSAASDVAASADKVRIERAALFPTVRLSFGAGSGAIGDGKGTLQLTGRQLLTDFGNTDRQVTAADVSLQIKYLTFQKAVDDAVVELIRAYNSVAIYKDLLEVRQEQLAGMQDLANHVEERVTAGASSDTDLLETRKRLQSAEFQVQDAELSLADARDRLVRLSGQPEGGKVTPPRADCSMPFESNDLRIARLQVIKSELDLQTAQKSRMPRVSLSPLARAGESGGLGLNLSVDSDVLQGGRIYSASQCCSPCLGCSESFGRGANARQCTGCPKTQARYSGCRSAPGYAETADRAAEENPKPVSEPVFRSRNSDNLGNARQRRGILRASGRSGRIGVLGSVEPSGLCFDGTNVAAGLRIEFEEDLRFASET